MRLLKLKIANTSPFVLSMSLGPNGDRAGAEPVIGMVDILDGVVTGAKTVSFELDSVVQETLLFEFGHEG